jgi:hypothetical protein
VKGLLALWILVVSHPAFADGTWDGGQPASYAKLAPGARSAGMGSAQSAVADDAYALAYNPAGMAQVERSELGSQTASFPLGRQAYYFSLVTPIQADSPYHVGFSWSQFRLVDGIEARVKNTPEPDALLGVADDVFSVGFGSWIPGSDNLAAGVAFKLLQDDLGDSNSSGFGLDLGFLYVLQPGLKLAVVMQDIYTAVTWNTGSNEQVPVDTRLALAWQVPGWSLLVTGELEKSLVQGLKDRLGLEWRPLAGVALRGGFNNGGLAAGAGLVLPVVKRLDARIDYAAATDRTADWEFGSLSHRLSLTLAFTLERDEEKP